MKDYIYMVFEKYGWKAWAVVIMILVALTYNV